MSIKLCSFNCKGFNVSKIRHISEILLTCDILLLQETWLLQSQVGCFNKYFDNFNTCGISGMDENKLLLGRNYGGCSMLYKKSMSSLISYIDLSSKRVCCMKIKSATNYLYIFNVYMPCDTSNNDFLQEYNDVLSTISICMASYKTEYCIIAGDMNTDLSRHKSGNTISLHSFIENENLYFAINKIPNKVPFTFTGIKDNHSLIDHFIISKNMIDTCGNRLPYLRLL